MPKFLIAPLLLLAQYAIAHQIDADKARAIDGDTIEILYDNQSLRVRLQGIDAPERQQDFGKRAKQTLAICLTHGDVRVHYQKTDRYGRAVGTVFSGDTNCNLAQLKKGMAWHYKAYEKEQSPTDRRVYSQAHARAKKRKLGLWSRPCPIAPWDWRKGKKDCQN